MAVNKRIAKKRAKMAAEKEAKAAAKTVVEVKAKEIPIVKTEPVVEEVPVVEAAPVVEDKKEEVTEVVEKKTTRKRTTKAKAEVSEETVEKKTTKKRTTKKDVEVVETMGELAEKKPAAKKPRKKAVKVSLTVQAGGKEVTMDEAIARVKEAWVADGNSEKDLKELAVYAKPEEQAIYYVANGTVTGKVAF